MAYRRKGSVDLKTASIETLEGLLPDARSRVLYRTHALEEYIATQLNGVTPEELRAELAELKRRLAPYNEAMDKLHVFLPSKSLLGKIFGGVEWPKDLQAQWRAVYAQRKPLADQHSQRHTQEERLKEKEDELKKAKSWLSRIETAISRKRKKKDLIVELRASAAKNSEETRNVATTVIKGLVRSHECPYCGGELGKNPHADHIYPVSKGGKSVPKNMVYACFQCNSKKTDLTLTAFIKKYSLDRDAIEERLIRLHKDF